MRERAVRMMTSHAPEHYVKAAEFYTSMPNLAPRLKEVGCPMLGICGDDDPCPDDPNLLAAAKNFRQIWIAGCQTVHHAGSAGSLQFRAGTFSRDACPEQVLRDQEAGRGVDAAAGPGRRPDHEQPLDRRAVPRPAAKRPRQIVLVQVMAAGDAIAADEVRILALEVLRRHDVAREDRLLRAGCMLHELLDQPGRRTPP